MARNRKIPARKHHGVRDPLKQSEDKEKKLRHVVNNPPDKGGDQKVSFAFKQFKKMADEAKAGKKMKRIHIGREDKPRLEKAKKGKKGAAKQGEGNKFRQIKQFLDETDVDYMKRVNRATTESLREAEYEAKYGVNVVRNAQTGEISLKKQPKNEIDEMLKKKQNLHMNRRNTGKKAKAPKEMIDKKTAKELIKQAIKEDEEEKKKAKIEIAEYKTDVFKFGETVHAPPTLSTLPRKATKSETVPRPGMKNNLLLKSMLNADESATQTTKAVAKANAQPVSSRILKAQMKGKRKDLPAATRNMLEQEQNKMIELYRQLKKTKVKQF